MSESSTTRADDSEGDITLAGEEGERAIKVVNVYVFKKDSTARSGVYGYYDYFWSLAEKQDIKTFTQEQVGSKVTQFGTVVFKALQKNTPYRLYAVVNGKAINASGEEWTTKTKEEEFLLNSRFVQDVSSTTTNDANTSASSSANSSIASALRTKAEETVHSIVPGLFATSNYNDGLPSLEAFNNCGLIMASRQFDDMVGTTAQNVSTPYVEFTIENDNSENNPTSVVIAVERVMARLDLGLKDGGSGYDGSLYVPTSSGSDSNNKYATVTLTGYYPVNISQQSYLFRHRSQDLNAAAPYYYNNLSDANYTYGTEWTAADYIVDPFTTQKTTKYENGSLPTNYASMYYNPLHKVTAETNSLASTRKMLDIPEWTTDESGTKTAPATIGYCLENTTTATYQQKEFSTALVLAGTVEPEPDHVFFDCGGVPYTYAQLSQLVSDLGSTGMNATKINEANGKYEVAKDAYTGDNGAQADSTAKKSAYETAKSAYETAKSAYETALANSSDDLDTKKAEYNSAYTDYQAALSAYNAAVTAAKTAENAVLAAEATLKSLQTDASTASTALNTAKDSVDSNGKYTGDVLYYYNYNFYTSLKALSDVIALPELNKNDENGKEIFSDGEKSNRQILSDYGITLYTRDNSAYRTGGTETNFVTYYLYVIKHYQHGTTTDAQLMAPMKYAIVRNNVYQMIVSGVVALGSSSPDPTDPDPEDSYYPGPNPDDDNEVYLKMELKVRHWVVRDQGDIKLK
jgi:hypothetical protein